jgi:hypothetical protein
VARDALAEIEHRDANGDLLHHRHVVVDDQDRARCCVLTAVPRRHKNSPFGLLELIRPNATTYFGSTVGAQIM